MTTPNPDPAPETLPAETPPVPDSPAPPPSPEPAPVDVDGDGTLADLRQAVSSLADVVTTLVTDVSNAAGDGDKTPEQLPWHKKPWFK